MIGFKAVISSTTTVCTCQLVGVGSPKLLYLGSTPPYEVIFWLIRLQSGSGSVAPVKLLINTALRGQERESQIYHRWVYLILYRGVICFTPASSCIYLPKRTSTYIVCHVVSMVEKGGRPLIPGSISRVSGLELTLRLNLVPGTALLYPYCQEIDLLVLVISHILYIHTMQSGYKLVDMAHRDRVGTTYLGIDCSHPRIPCKVVRQTTGDRTSLFVHLTPSVDLAKYLYIRYNLP